MITLNKPTFFFSIFIFLLLSILIFYGGLFASPYLLNKNKVPFYSRQLNEVLGQVVKVEGRILTITNQAGMIEKLEASDNIAIIKPRNEPAAPPLHELSAIELNKEAKIVAEFMDGKFKVTAIQYSSGN